MGHSHAFFARMNSGKSSTCQHYRKLFFNLTRKQLAHPRVSLCCPGRSKRQLSSASQLQLSKCSYGNSTTKIDWRGRHNAPERNLQKTLSQLQAFSVCTESPALIFYKEVCLTTRFGIYYLICCYPSKNLLT